MVAAYLEIESLRLGPKLKVEMAIDEAARAIPIPVLSIQPLVENAVRHGIAPLEAGGRVRGGGARGRRPPERAGL